MGPPGLLGRQLRRHRGALDNGAPAATQLVDRRQSPTSHEKLICDQGFAGSRKSDSSPLARGRV
jgi:hypothetical protein